MKKVNLIFAAIMISFVAYLTSCNFDVPDSTVITWTQDFDTVDVGVSTDVTFEITMKPDVLNNISVTNLFIEENGVTLDSVVFTQVAQTVTHTFVYTVPANAGEGDIDILFTAWDNNNGIITETATIVVGNTSALPSIVTGSGTVNYSSTSATTEFGWQLTANAKGVTVTQVNSADADLTFFFNDTYRQQILSPDAAQIEAQDAYSTWDYDVTGKKTTKIAIASSSDWTNATEESINNLTVNSEVHPGGGNGIDLVAADDVFAIELSDGRKGLAKVTASNPPYKGMAIASSLTLEFKFQATANSSK